MAANQCMSKGKAKAKRACEDNAATRAVRFSFEENSILIAKVCEYYDEIIGMAAPETPQKKKNELWKKIVDAVNTVGGNNRTELVVKKRYFDVKRQLKRKLCKAASHVTETGGEKSEDADLTSYEEELLQVLVPGTDIEAIDDTDSTTIIAETTKSYKKKNELRQKIMDAVKAVGNNHTDRVVKKRYFDVKRQLKRKLSRAPFQARRIGSSHPNHVDLANGELLETLGLEAIMRVKGSVDTDLPLASQGPISPVHLTKEEPRTSESPQFQAPDQLSGPVRSIDSTRYVFKLSPCSETHQLEEDEEPSGSLQTTMLSGDQEEIISIIVGSEEVPSTSAGICPQSSAVSSSSSPSSGHLDASVAALVDKTTEQLNKMSDLMLAQSHTSASQHSEILEVLHGIRNDLNELRHQTQISNEVQNQKRLDNRLFRSELLQLKREKLDILRMKYDLEPPNTSRPLNEQLKEETSSNEEEFSPPQMKKMCKGKERFILFL
ncbi:Hypothetical predicted protein [Pelobates cultripes]|uniref:Myb/SANT-like DNA-binding domain-containing protein n=1 Tax=Pelobates cultripes TaxID=61616 RepID=A0AAD1WBG7_PELCU|nr:Hypothetical predicted protein [Pelobates cultripes]